MKYALRGHFERGLFPDEAFVTFSDHSGHEVSLVAPSSLVRQTGDQAYVEVRVLESREGLVLVQLPGEVYGSNGGMTGREVTVSKDLLVQA